ncbi:MAG: peptidylprolyl isomerase [Ichthyobacteriaceae bacterium]|nr:peptidylprolyl isomerase [Ichthyobacteriaceae bacterium]
MALSIQSCNNNSRPDGIYGEFETNKGTITVQLFYKATPMTSANFIGLAEGNIENNFKKIGDPFYDGLKFHRVIPDFMIQGGDPLGSGAGGPGYKFEDEFVDSLKHEGKGILSMANSGPNTNGSQFFITHKSTPWLDGKHTVFGKVVEGLNLVDSIKQNDNIISLKIVRVGEDAEEFDAPAVFKKMQQDSKAELEKATLKQERLRKDLISSLTKGAESVETTKSGLTIIKTKEGNGSTPKKGDEVKVEYKGMLLNGKVFDSSEGKDPIKFPIGQGRVIPGWDEGIMKLKEGDEATLVIPSYLAYGAKEIKGFIPANSDLVFEVKLVEIVK